MSFEKQFDDMIEAGRNVIDTDFDPVAFQQWRAHAITCLSSLMEHDHAYAKYFIKPLHHSSIQNGNYLHKRARCPQRYYGGEQLVWKRR
jgi:hypothetical protein